MYEPTWKEHEKAITNPNPKIARKAGEAFEEARKKETSISKKAQDWENARKKEIQNNKITFVKNHENKLKEDREKPLKALKNLGDIPTSIKPSPGYILIKIIKDTARESEGGILLPESAETVNNIAEVLKVGVETEEEKPWFKQGDRVLLKRFAGADISIAGQPLKLCQFSDVLGVLEDNG